MRQKLWCIELERMMTAADVWHYRFVDGNGNRTLTFCCPDESCAASFTTMDCVEILSPDCARFVLSGNCTGGCGCMVSCSP